MKKIIYPIVLISLVLTCSCCKSSKKNVKNGQFPLINWAAAWAERLELPTTKVSKV